MKREREGKKYVSRRRINLYARVHARNINVNSSGHVEISREDCFAIDGERSKHFFVINKYRFITLVDELHNLI